MNQAEHPSTEAPPRNPGRKRHRWLSALSVVLALLLGFILGVAGTLWVALDRFEKAVKAGPDHHTQRIMGVFERRLDLSDAQKEDVRPAVKEIMDELQAIRDENRPRVVHTVGSGLAEIRQALNDDQREKLDQLITRWTRFTAVEADEIQRAIRQSQDGPSDIKEE